MTTRNPSPPPDLSDELQHVDNIGDSAYSKRWLFSLLMQLLNYVKSVNDTHGTETEVYELDPELETKLCCLWDLTVNSDIIPHLDEFNLIQILTDVLLCHQYPRLQEIIIGILANLAYNSDCCHKISENEGCINRVLNLFYSRDTQTLTVVCRLIQAVIASEENNALWIDRIRFQGDFFDNLIYILKCSTNNSLLISTVRLVDAITRADDSLAEIWCVPELLEAVLIAQHQMKWMHGDEVEIVYRLLYTFSSNANGVAALITLFEELLPTFGVYLRKVCEDEPCLIPFPTYHNSLRAIVPVLDCVIASVPAHSSVTCFKNDQTIMPCLLHIATGCHKQMHSVPMVKGILTDLRILFRDLTSVILDYFQQLSPPNESVTAATATAASEVSESLRWLTDLDRDQPGQVNGGRDNLYPNLTETQAVELREGFIRCCLDDADEHMRGKLIYICHYLKLTKLLETITDDS